jgi:isoquinoline 1-oxidoreductase beta subunit
MTDPGDSNPSPTADQPQRTWTISRRGFLVGMAATGTALALGIPQGLPILRRNLAGLTEGDASGFASGSLDPLLWIEILPDDQVRLFLPKAEMGQGIHTSLAQIAAEELEVRWEQLEAVHATTAQADDNFRGTSGSMSVTTLYDPLRQAAATLREMLRARAATYLDRPARDLVARDGGFELAGDPASRVSYGTLVAAGGTWQIPEEDVPLKPASEFKFIGQSLPRVDLRAKVTGEAIYGYDASAEGMLFGAVARPPAIGATLRSARPAGAAAMPGVIQVVIEGGFAAVVARTRLQAAAAVSALELDWEEGHLWQQAELEEMVSAGGRGGVTVQREGNAGAILDRGAPLAAEYRTGFGAHATMEPQAALADIGAGGGRVWTSTQFEMTVRDDVAKAVGLEPGQIEVIPTYLGGGFGRKIHLDLVPSVAVEAARLSRAVGAPVHVGWDRSEEMRHGFFRPLTHHRLSAALDGSGRVEAIAYQQASGDALLGAFPAVAGRIMGFDFGSARAARIAYAVPNIDVTVWRRPLPVPTGSWRGLGILPNIFAVESFMDELAHAAGADPLQFRLDHLPGDPLGQRMRSVLEAAAELAGWGTAVAQDHAQGIACCLEGGTIVAEVAEITLDRDSGRIQVPRVAAAMDCGRTVNPDGAIAQVEGCIVMGTSAALGEELLIQDGRVVASNFDRYPLLRLRAAPRVETVLLEAPDGKPRGVGEPPIGPISPAIGNAFYALTGVRLRQLPMTPERVKAALGA